MNLLKEEVDALKLAFAVEKTFEREPSVKDEKRKDSFGCSKNIE